jgi:hypothetical protein
MQANYRAIFMEMLLAQSAAVGACADIAGRCAALAAQPYQQAALTLARKMRPEGDAAEPGHRGSSVNAGAAAPRPADFARALAGLPRQSMLLFFSRYDQLRGRRSVVQD